MHKRIHSQPTSHTHTHTHRQTNTNERMSKRTNVRTSKRVTTDGLCECTYCLAIGIIAAHSHGKLCRRGCCCCGFFSFSSFVHFIHICVQWRCLRMSTNSSRYELFVCVCAFVYFFNVFFFLLLSFRRFHWGRWIMMCIGVDKVPTHNV